MHLEVIMSGFDTLNYTKRLKAAGVPAEQAEAHTMALADVLALQTASKADLELLNFDLSARMERLELFVKEQIAILRTEMQQQKADLLKWMFLLAAGQTSIIIGAVRYMSH
jgi:hypothetical protein